MWMRFGPGLGVSEGLKEGEQRNRDDSDDLPTRTRDWVRRVTAILRMAHCALFAMRWATFAAHNLWSRDGEMSYAPKVSGMSAGGEAVRQASMAREIIFR